MGSLQWKAINSIGAILGVSFMLPNLAPAQSQTTAAQIGQPNRVSIAYVPTDDLVLKEVYVSYENVVPWRESKRC